VFGYLGETLPPKLWPARTTGPGAASSAATTVRT
jgi:hypothetical protein